MPASDARSVGCGLLNVWHMSAVTLVPDFFFFFFFFFGLNQKQISHLAFHLIFHLFHRLTVKRLFVDCVFAFGSFSF